MPLALPGSSVDGTITVRPAYGLAVLALLMVVGRRRERRDGAGAAVPVTAVPGTAVPGTAVVAFGVNSAVEPPAAAAPPFRNLAFRTMAACSARGDGAFPGDHAAVAVAAAVARFSVSRRLGAVALVLLAMTVPRRLPAGLPGRPAGTWPRPLPGAGTP
jgi:undecaprenyl-diphosphatase